MDGSYPIPVARWLEATSGHVEPQRTAVIEGRSRFRREGKGLWLPIEAVMWHELGAAHVADLRVGLGPLTVVRGMDAYVDGVGFSRISHTLETGPEIDQSAALFMWAEAILFPASWRERDDVSWEAVAEHRTEVSLPFAGERLTASLDFDASTGLPARFGADRYKGLGSRPVRWQVDYADWRLTTDDVLLPSLATVAWSDEPGPWFRMWIERANPDADVSDAMSRARAQLSAIQADPIRRHS